MTIRYPNIRLYKLERTTSDTEMEDQVEQIQNCRIEFSRGSRVEAGLNGQAQQATGRRTPIGGKVLAKYIWEVLWKVLAKYMIDMYNQKHGIQ